MIILLFSNSNLCEQIHHIQYNVKIRPVEKKDWKFILHLRNLEDIRLAFHDSSIINDETHLKYMQKMEANPNFFQWIITYNKKDVGYIKIDGLVFGSMLLNEYRGEGIGKQAYALVFKEAKKAWSYEANRPS